MMHRVVRNSQFAPENVPIGVKKPASAGYFEVEGGATAPVVLVLAPPVDPGQ